MESTGESRDTYITDFREYNPLIAKWNSIDPKEMVQPWQRPYAAINNSPIWRNDPKGDLAPIVIWMLKKAGDAAIGVMTDIAVQLVAERYFGNHGSWEEAWRSMDIDWAQASASGGANLVKNKHLAAAINAGGSVLSYYLREENPNWEGAMTSGVIGGISTYIAGGISKYISKYGGRAVANGLEKMGVTTEVIERLTNVKNWTKYTTDPKVGELANAIDDFFGTGTIKGVAEEYAEHLGYAAGDYDIVMDKIIVSVKTGSGAGSTSQAVKEMGQAMLAGKKYVFVSFDKDFGGAVEKALKSKVEYFRLVKSKVRGGGGGQLDVKELLRLMNYISQNK